MPSMHISSSVLMSAFPIFQAMSMQHPVNDLSILPIILVLYSWILEKV